MELYTIESGLIPTNGYLLIDDSKKNAVIIDAPQDSLSRFEKLIWDKDVKVHAIILTHSHWDHSADANAMKVKFKAPIYAHKADEYRLIEPMKYTVISLPTLIEPCSIDVPIQDFSVLTVGDLVLEFRHTPGHTEGGICVIVKSKEIVFTGDSLFGGSIGRTDLPGGSTEVLLNSINNIIMTLPDSFIVYPGHGDVTTIATERLTNPFL